MCTADMSIQKKRDRSAAVLSAIEPDPVFMVVSSTIRIGSSNRF